MAWPIIVAWIHYVGIMLLIASLLGEHLLLKQELTAAEAKTIQRLDIVYGASAMIVLVTGIMRMFLEKGCELLQSPRRVSHSVWNFCHRRLALDLSDAGVSALAVRYARGARAATGARSVRQAPDGSACGNDPVAAGAVFRDLDGPRRVLESIEASEQNQLRQT
jgi:Predicted membrane protein (DUF2214)